MKGKSRGSQGKDAQESSRHLPATVLFTYLFIGFYAIIIQTILFRELLVVAMGNEIILGISLFNWLMGVFCGALISGILVEKMTRGLQIFLLSLLALIILTPLSITFIRFLYHVSQTPAGGYIHFFKVFYLSAAGIVPLSFFIGFTFPIASKIQSQRQTGSPGNVTRISRVYILEALGSLVGGSLVSFVLLGRFNPYLIVSATAVPLIVFMVINAWLARQKTLTGLLAVFLLLESGFIAFGLHRDIHAFSLEKRWRGFSQSRLLWTRDSRYQNLALGEDFGQANLFSNGQFIGSFPEKQDNMIQAARLMTQHPAPKRILIIGEALSGLARSLLAYDIETLTSIELDPVLVRGIKTFLPPSHKRVLTDNRFTIRIGDGRKFLINREPGDRPWDILFVNSAEPSTLLLNRFYTLEFFRDASRILSPDGVLSLCISSSENYAAGTVSRYTASVFQTLKKVFPHVVVAPGDKNYFFACRAPGIISASPDTLSARYLKAGVPPRKLAMVFPSLYPEEKTDFIFRSLLNQRTTGINTDEKPVTVLFFNKILGWISRGREETFFTFFEKITVGDILVTLLALVGMILGLIAIRIFIRERGSGKKTGGAALGAGITGSLTSRFPLVYLVICGGFAGISLELMAVYSFQNIYGYVYQLIGFIVALFMAGLPLGAAVTNGLLNRTNHSHGKPLVWLLVIQICFIALSLFFPLLLKWVPDLKTAGQAVMFLFIMVVGGGVGALFPLAIHLYSGRGGKTGRAAGIIDGSDHLGAAVGAFFTGAILLPILGIAGICQIIAAISALGAILVLLNPQLGKTG